MAIDIKLKYTSSPPQKSGLYYNVIIPHSGVISALALWRFEELLPLM